jgi:hypothetical protein
MSFLITNCLSLLHSKSEILRRPNVFVLVDLFCKIQTNEPYLTVQSVLYFRTSFFSVSNAFDRIKNFAVIVCSRKEMKNNILQIQNSWAKIKVIFCLEQCLPIKSRKFQQRSFLSLSFSLQKYEIVFLCRSFFLFAQKHYAIICIALSQMQKWRKCDIKSFFIDFEIPYSGFLK